MNRCLASLLLLSTLVFGGQLSMAEDKGDEDGPSIEEQMAEVIALGPGVHNIQKDKKGHITACIVVGQARISTALGKAKGIENARDKANLACSAEFVKWLKEEVTVYQSNDEETVTLLEGSEEGEEESLKESAKSVEKSSKKMESLSKGLVRGLQVLHKDVNAEDKTLTIVKGWKLSTAQGVKKVADDLASDEPEVNESKKSGGAGSKKPKSKKIEKDIESDSATSDDADEFFPKKKNP